MGSDETDKTNPAETTSIVALAVEVASATRRRPD